jgi:glycine/D-amino acid oxidase-like deaminating enzyme
LTVDEAAPRWPRLTYDLDVEVCVVGAGLAGLHVALEAARRGASVAVLEGREIGWNASGAQLGTVMPGFGVPLSDLIPRVGMKHATALWALSQAGAESVRAIAADPAMGDVAYTEGALEVSNVDIGDRLIERLQLLGDLGSEVEGWQVDHVRGVLKTDRYFHAIHYPQAFQLDGRKYLRGLVALARHAGVRFFEDTPAVSIDPAGIRKRIVTPLARMRAEQVVLAGNIHLGDPLKRLSDTLLPVWRHAALTQPLGEALSEAIAFHGSVADTDGVDHFRIVGGDRLLWSSPETTWPARPERFAGAIQRRIRTVFPQLREVAIARVWSGVVGQTVHGMPQIGELRKGLWVASGFGRQGLNTTAMAGQLIARGMSDKDDRWRLFSPFELVWAGGRTGRIAGHAIGVAARQASAAAGLLSRYRERAAVRAARSEARLAAANRGAGIRQRPPERSAAEPAPPPRDPPPRDNVSRN